MKSLKITPSITDRQDASLGLYFKDVSKQPMISPEEEIELTKEIKKGNDAAAEKLIRANLRFVISVAKQYQGKGLPLIDLIQEGNCGLIEASKKFDESRGFRFISYAVWWIRQSIMKAISDQCRTIRVPMSQVVSISKINKVSDKFEQIHGRRPSPEEIEEEVNLDASKIGVTLASNNKAVSLDSPFKDEEVSCLLDVLPNEDSTPADSDVSKNDVTNGIESVLAKLPYRDRDIIRMSFGIGMNPMPNDEIANRFGIGGERVRQIQHSTLSYIKKNYADELKDLL
jgi:RNA polymerase primary sigma factor|nr:MAG TPA: DNA directed RNA polymerase subunit [Caudoviricetes sp.]